MAAPQANEVRPGFPGSAPRRGRGQPRDRQHSAANEHTGRLALGIAPGAWAGPRRRDKMNDMRCANGRVERTSGPVRALRGRGFSFGAGTPRGAEREDESIRGRLLGHWRGVLPGYPAADNCLGRGFPAVLSRGAPPTMHRRRLRPGGRGAVTPGSGRGRMRRALRTLGELWPALVPQGIR